MTHLSAEQISNWLIGERLGESSRHLESCERCCEEIARLEAGLACFRQGIREWAGESAVVEVRQEARRMRAPRLAWAWAVVAALTLSVVLVPLYRDARRAEQEAQIARDAALLDQVELRIMRTVPQSMEQLMELMKEDSGGLQ